jgi:23S rRNA (cytidine1920-2'-O)/16S rRNA (cytidine1409-2'-O)-methyltransferase
VSGTSRIRLDELVVARGLAESRSLARSLIMAGLVLVNGVRKDKPGVPMPADAEICLKERPRFVSRAGEKLAFALDRFGLDVHDAMAMDVGASTGGFVDCLLQRGATAVIALDVGHGQLDSRLRRDPRVHVIERTNARYLSPDQLPFRADTLTMDVSFISVEKVLPAVTASMASRFRGALLVKPQFEAGRDRVGRGGVVRNPEVHRQVLLRVGGFVITQLELEVCGICESGLRGADGNVEFFLHVERGGEKGMGLDTLGRTVDENLEALAIQRGGR